MDYLHLTLRIIHIGAGILWVGGTLMMTFFVAPAAGSHRGIWSKIYEATYVSPAIWAKDGGGGGVNASGRLRVILARLGRLHERVDVFKRRDGVRYRRWVRADRFYLRHIDWAKYKSLNPTRRTSAGQTFGRANGANADNAKTVGDVFIYRVCNPHPLRDLHGDCAVPGILGADEI
jgi:hypothetical protein